MTARAILDGSGPTTFTAEAWAKVNLTLAVHGRRPDGYHELESLVVFADIGDRLTLDTSRSLELSVTGRFSAGIAGPSNLVWQAAETVRSREPAARLGAFHLEKRLPVAAGIGGGSADAAAALRLILAVNPDLEENLDWLGLAKSLGADVPVCLKGAPALMSGIGENIAPVGRIGDLWIVLANPGVPLSTASVFKGLDAGPVASASSSGSQSPPQLHTMTALLDYVERGRNDLEPAAKRLCPVISQVCASLEGLQGALVVRMSGSGPTCFALFGDRGGAERGAAALSAAQPEWWVEAAPLRIS